MVAYILLMLIIGILIGITLGIGYLCLEFVVRLIGRGLGAEAPTENARRRSSFA
jgi:hypothetical protein